MKKQQHPSKHLNKKSHNNDGRKFHGILFTLAHLLLGTRQNGQEETSQWSGGILSSSLKTEGKEWNVLAIF